MTTRRAVVSLLLAMLALAACGPGAPVALWTSGTLGQHESICFTSANDGLLVPDQVAGTALVESNGHSYPVVWPRGYTGRQAGSEVEIINTAGKVVHKTGQQVHLLGGYADVPGGGRGWLVCNLELPEQGRSKGVDRGEV